MGDFLNIISEDYELLNESHYYLRIYDQVIKNNTIKSKLRTVGVNNLNYCTLDEAILNKDKTYVYFLFKQSDYTYSDSKRYLDKKFINALRENNNIKLIYFIEDESIDFENFRLIDSYCEFENLNQRSVYVYNNNANMDFFIKKIGSKLNVFKSSFLPITYSKKFIDFNIEFKPDKKFLFLVQNKRLKNHRFATMCFLMKNNILSKTDWSFIENHMLGEFDFFKSIFLHNLLDDSSVYENEIKVFPNPASNNVSIHYNLKANALVKIELFDMVGKSVKLLLPETQQSIDTHKKSWPINDVSAGLYFIKMIINGEESTIKLSVTH
jgi:hypothetical protein